jgi:hypothetical protein
VFGSLELVVVDYPEDISQINSGSLVLYLFTHLSMA